MLTIKIGGVPEHFNAPWKWAIDNGVFDAAGIRVDFIDYATGTGAMCRDLSSANLDMAVVLTEGIVAHCAQEHDCCIVAPYVDTPLTWGIYVGADTTLTHLAGLRHAEVAVSRLGSGSHLMAKIMLTQALQVDQSQQQFHVVGGIEALCQAVNATPQQFFMWEVFTTEPWLQKGRIRLLDTYPTPWPCFQIAARRQWLCDHHTEVQRLLEKLYRVTQRFNHDHAFAIEVIAHYYGLQPERIQRWLDSVCWAIDPANQFMAIEQASNTLQQIGVLPITPSSSDLITVF